MRSINVIGLFTGYLAGQLSQVYWTFTFVWRGEDIGEDVDRFPSAQPGFHFRPPTR